MKCVLAMLVVTLLASSVYVCVHAEGAPMDMPHWAQQEVVQQNQ